MNAPPTAGLPLKIFNYEFLCFEPKRSPSELSTRSSIIKDLENHLLHGEMDYSQHELSESKSDEQDSDCEATIADRVNTP
ncbi:hypothetical protein [Pseudomonas fluorescens]|uniref:hypothetical protein n=1 Tax=Pseudomonas fluorescens TaxID=294 RepID=UPI00124150B0|nr:hypothetical protein [Pseudomonas fluorescens]